MKRRTFYFSFFIFNFSLILFSSCVEELKEENFYTFTGEMIADYLDNRSETFSSFTYVLQRAGVKQLLAAYGEYTCFAPTNEAFDIYLREKGYADINQLTDADCDTIAFGHVIKVAYLTTDLDNGVVGTANMNARFIQVYIDSITSDYYVNRDSRIILKDQEVENGVVQVVDRVLLPSTEQLPDLIDADEKCTLFSAALKLTHLDDSLQKYMDEKYVYDEAIYDYTRQGEKCPKPKHRRFGYTAFVETDEAFRAAGITTLDELIAYAQTVYGASFPDERGRFDSDYTHRRNPLNRFVAYHLLARTIYASKMTTTTSIMPQYESVDYYETMCPGTIIRVEKGQGTRYKGLRINRRWDKQFTMPDGTPYLVAWRCKMRVVLTETTASIITSTVRWFSIPMYVTKCSTCVCVSTPPRSCPSSPPMASTATTSGCATGFLMAIPRT